MSDLQGIRGKRARAGGAYPPPLGPDAALFLDIDGTLADFAPNPHDVRIDAGFRDRLLRLADQLDGALALITGRSIADADRLFSNGRLPLAGQHGCERRDAMGRVHLRAPPLAPSTRVRERLQSIAALVDGVWVEDKGVALALHYRGAPAMGPYVRHAVKTALPTTEANAYVVEPGKMLVELRPGDCDKGQAIREFMCEAPFRGRRPVFLGDDASDEHGFAVVEDLAGWSIKVGQGASLARYRLPDIAAVRAWVCMIEPAAATGSKAAALR